MNELELVVEISKGPMTLIFIVSVCFCWVFLPDWYVFKGKSSEGLDIYFSYGLLTRCTDTGYHFYKAKNSKK
ncbi:hypothetical protein HZS_7363 [Henneguya salminicola]|nr:hypothetical protein HZS_7363 [Henneguya salminicola]